jgi:hypothetical protein
LGDGSVNRCGVRDIGRPQYLLMQALKLRTRFHTELGYQPFTGLAKCRRRIGPPPRPV